MDMENILIIEVNEGIADAILVPEGVDYFQVDYDCLENWQCPHCGNELEEDGLCVDCDWNWMEKDKDTIDFVKHWISKHE